MTDLDELDELLQTLQTMLKKEAEKWDDTNNSKMAEKIALNYASIELLLLFIRDEDLGGLVTAFKIKNLTNKGICGCFRRDPQSVRHRNEARLLFGSFCHKMIVILGENA